MQWPVAKVPEQRSPAFWAPGRRAGVGKVASLRLECLDVDEHGKDVLVYDNHKAAKMGRRLPLADPALVADIRPRMLG